MLLAPTCAKKTPATTSSTTSGMFQASLIDLFIRVRATPSVKDNRGREADVNMNQRKLFWTFFLIW